mgnify:FL=1
MMPRLAAMMRSRAAPPKPSPTIPATLPEYVRTDAGLRTLNNRARNLAAFRAKTGLNPFRMAQRLEMIPTNYTNAESGLRPITLRHIDAIAAAFNMTPAEVLAMLDAEVGP